MVLAVAVRATDAGSRMRAPRPLLGELGLQPAMTRFAVLAEQSGPPWLVRSRRIELFRRQADPRQQDLASEQCRCELDDLVGSRRFVRARRVGGRELALDRMSELLWPPDDPTVESADP